MHCPKCGFEQPAGAECVSCGIIFSKYEESQAFPPVVPPPRSRMALRTPDPDVVLDGRVGPKELKILGGGLLAAIVIYAIPFTRFVLSAMVTLFHELGHAVVGWLLGYPSLPAFDFVYGGGLTSYGQFHLSIVIAIGAGFAWLGWTFRHNTKTLLVLGGIFLLWLLVVSAGWRREMAMAGAGHAFEFILAGIFFYQALSGTGWRSPDLERPLGAFVAFFVQIHSMAFALRLRSDASFLDWYRGGKGGMLMNDLEQIALDLKIHTPLVHSTIEGVAGALLVFSLLPIAIALLWYFYRSRWHRLLGELLQTSPGTA